MSIDVVGVIAVLHRCGVLPSGVLALDQYMCFRRKMLVRQYSHESVEPQNQSMGTPNDHDQACAEKLFLLGEMLATASQYLTQCGDVMNCEDSFMLGLAADEVPSLRFRCMELSKDLGTFEKRVREHIKGHSVLRSEDKPPSD